MDMEKRMNGGEEEGAISKLPKDLLCHILSFLPTKEAALTSVLSKSWRDLFTLIPSLDLNDSIFVHGERPVGCQRTSFVEFVNRVLALQSDSPITKFSLMCHDGVDDDHVNNWVLKALRRGATDITLILLFPSLGYSLPSSIFSYGQNLIKLRLGCGELGLFRTLTQGEFIFAKLRILQLVAIPFGERCTLLNLFLSNCPVLEELILLNCGWRSAALISSPTIKRLTIDPKHHLPREHNLTYFVKLGTRCGPRTHLVFDTPNLTYLNYSDVSPRNYPLVKLDSLVEARLDVGSTKAQMHVRDTYDQDHVRRDATKLIMGIHNVQILHLSSSTLEVISFLGETLPVFHNLSRLTIESKAEGGWQFLPLLLIKCPNLQTLVFLGPHHMLTDGFEDVCDGIPPSSCLSSCPVKVLKMLEFGGTSAELSLVEHFLKELPLLEQAIIVSSEYEDFDIFEVSEALKMVSRASLNCKLEVLIY